MSIYSPLPSVPPLLSPLSVSLPLHMEMRTRRRGRPGDRRPPPRCMSGAPPALPAQPIPAITPCYATVTTD